jgi:hypothetical protein
VIRTLALCMTIALPLASHTQLTKPAQTPAKPATRESLAGMYNGGQMEVGALLQLKPDGHFRYELAYGAMDEVAQGTWEFKDGAVFLTTVPAVKPPQFVVESDVPDSRGGLWIKLSSGAVMDGARQNIYLFYDDNFTASAQPDRVTVGDDGKVPLPQNKMPKFIIPEIPVYPILNKPIPVNGIAGHLITMRFEPNDIGKADFRALKLDIKDGVLRMARPDLGLGLEFKPQPPTPQAAH